MSGQSGSPRAEAWADLPGLAADPRHQGRSAEQQGRPRGHPVKAQPGLPPVEPARLDDGEPLPWDGGAVDLRPQGQGRHRLQGVDEVIQQRPVVPPGHAVHQVLTRQPPRDPRVIAPGDLPTPPFRQLLGHLVVRLFHAPPPSVQGLSAIEASGPQITSFANVGISGILHSLGLTESRGVRYINFMLYILGCTTGQWKGHIPSHLVVMS